MITINPHLVNGVRCDVYTLKTARHRSDAALAVLRSGDDKPFDLDLSQARFTDKRASKLYQIWISLGAHPETAKAAVIIAYNESRFDGKAINRSSGAIGLYQALSPNFEKVAVRSAKLEDHIPVMEVMMKLYKMNNKISLHSLYAMHFQGRYAGKNVDKLRGFVAENGSTLGGQYAVTDGRSSWTDLALLSVSALMWAFDIMDAGPVLTVTCPKKVIDYRIKREYTAMTSIARYTGTEHVPLDSGVSMQSISVDGAANFFISDPKLEIQYIQPHVTSYPISNAWTAEVPSSN
jgi:hypothetical protein